MKLTDEMKVSLVTAACIIAISFAARHSPGNNLDLVSRYGPFFMLLTYIAMRGSTYKQMFDKPLLWSAAIVAVTIATVVYFVL